MAYARYDAITVSTARNTSHPGNTAALQPATATPLAEPVAVSHSVDATRWLAVGSLLGLMLLSVVWELWLAPLRPGGSWLVLKALPLAVPLIGLLKHRMYTYRWVSLMIWLYFTEGVVRAWSDTAPGRWLACVEIFLCLLLFVACAAHVRFRQKTARQQAANTQAAQAVQTAGAGVEAGASIDAGTESTKIPS